MARAWPDKDPDELLDYVVDWSARLAGDTIATSTWTVPVGLTSSNPSNTPDSATIWLAGGTEGKTYEVTNRIVTAGGRTMDETPTLTIRSR